MSFSVIAIPKFEKSLRGWLRNTLLLKQNILTWLIHLKLKRSRVHPSGIIALKSAFP
jgi:hypothetical protein